MTVSLFTKLYGTLLGPLIVAVGGSFLSTQLEVPSWLVVTAILVTFLFSLRTVLKLLLAISTLRREKAKKKYQNKSYEELKVLFMANPHEAVLFIDVSKSKQPSVFKTVNA